MIWSESLKLGKNLLKSKLSNSLIALYFDWNFKEIKFKIHQILKCIMHSSEKDEIWNLIQSADDKVQVRLQFQ